MTCSDTVANTTDTARESTADSSTDALNLSNQPDNDGKIDITDLVPDDDLKIITGKDRLNLAKYCLGGLLFVFCSSMFCYLGAVPESKAAAAAIWTDITKIIPPIATLVIGYFFGTREST